MGRLLKWAQAHSLWTYSTGSGCCADELLQTWGARYDLERFGCVEQVDPRQADLLIVAGMVSYKLTAHLRALYDQMLDPKYVLAIGACASCGGPFAPHLGYAVVGGVAQVLPVDVYVPGCPPRPEAIMNGFIALQKKINGQSSA